MQPEEIQRLGDIGFFSRVFSPFPLRAHHQAALRLDKRVTCILAHRQAGKSWAVALLAFWWAFTRPGNRVLVVSAGEQAAKDLLAKVRELVAHPLARGSVVDEGLMQVILTNGSVIRAVPSSERQVRGPSVDLLILDEAGGIEDAVINAAMPTTAARPDARIVMASNPWGQVGRFYRDIRASDRQKGNHPSIDVYRWTMVDSPWLSSEQVEHDRATMPAAQFAAEYEGQFAGVGNLYFDPAHVEAALADYQMLAPQDANDETVSLGLDWAKSFDRQAIVAVGVLDDYGLSARQVEGGRPVLLVPWLETASRSYGEQIGEVVDLVKGARSRGRAASRRLPNEVAGGKVQATTGGGLNASGTGMFFEDFGELTRWRTRLGLGHRPGCFHVPVIVSETNGVGDYPTEDLADKLGRPVQTRGEFEANPRRPVVVGWWTSLQSKMTAYGRVRALLARQQLVLPNELELKRQIRGVTFEMLPEGGMRIGADQESTHDDLTDALSLAVMGLPASWEAAYRPSESLALDSDEWVETGAGHLIPRRPRPCRTTLGRHPTTIRAE